MVAVLEDEQFAALLGTAENGRWLIAPKHPAVNVSRRYRSGTLILETEFKTESGSAAIVDFMPTGMGPMIISRTEYPNG